MSEKKSEIIEQCLKIKKVSKRVATHFALCNGGNIRYLISLNSAGKRNLCSNLSSYSSKLTLLIKLLRFIPFCILEMGEMGHFVSVELHDSVVEVVKNQRKHYWNMIIGTYDEKQKLVVQAFNDDISPAIYIKVGNIATDVAMRSEMKFLESAESFESFSIPELIEKHYMSDSRIFNIQVTKEFSGEKMGIGITSDVVRIYQEIAAIDSFDNCEFSHGDFTPWNLKKCKDGYVVYDWEHCSKRMKGFDILHYVAMPKVMLEHKELSKSVREAIEEIREYIPYFEIDETQFIKECKLLRLERGKL